ncbi:MAG: septation protein A [Hyphomicrobiaceae bacterium]|nr:septation protein A [Hyphomicrobiaceae bacterium]
MKSDPAKPQLADDRLSMQLLKLALEIGPLVVFFVANSSAGIFIATQWFMVATIVSIAASRLIFGKVAVMPLVTAVFVFIFGGLTIWLQDDHFIKMKPTIVNTIFSALLFGGLFFGHSLLRHVFGDVFKISDEGWKQLTIRWGAFFAALAILNEIVWRNFTTDNWVTFKTFGIMPLTMVFAMAQLGIIKRHELPEDAEGAGAKRDDDVM